MTRSLRDSVSAPTDRRKDEKDEGCDFRALLHPWQAFAHPFDVVRDIDLTTNEKRAILASWASDACAVEAAPALRRGALGNVVSWDDIMDALKALDQANRYSSPVSAVRGPLVPYKRRRGLGKLRNHDEGPAH